MRYHVLFLMVFGLSLAAAPGQAAEPDRYLPKDAKFVVAVNVRQVIDTPLFKKYALDQIKSGIKKNDDLRKLLEVLGFDPLKDVRSVVVAGPGVPEKVLLITRGSFDLEKIEAVTDEVAKNNESGWQMAG